jgi:2Fe-2S ferredoxin
MTKIRFLVNDTVTEVEGRIGESVMTAAVGAGIPGIIAECGGTCSCATCHVYVEGEVAEKLDPAHEDEEAMLEAAAAEVRPNSRLSCQIELRPWMDGLTVRVPQP